MVGLGLYFYAPREGDLMSRPGMGGETIEIATIDDETAQKLLAELDKAEEKAKEEQTKKELRVGPGTGPGGRSGQADRGEAARPGEVRRRVRFQRRERDAQVRSLRSEGESGRELGRRSGEPAGGTGHARRGNGASRSHGDAHAGTAEQVAGPSDATGPGRGCHARRDRAAGADGSRRACCPRAVATLATPRPPRRRLRRAVDRSCSRAPPRR